MGILQKWRHRGGSVSFIGAALSGRVARPEKTKQHDNTLLWGVSFELRIRWRRIHGVVSALEPRRLTN